MELKELTKAEEEVMQILWEIKKGFVKDVLGKFPSPKPAYNTVSTFIRILEQKGFVSYKAYGKTHEYFPKVSKETYREFITQKIMNSYFDNSPKNLVSYFLENENLDLKEVDEIMNIIKQMKK